VRHSLIFFLVLAAAASLAQAKPPDAGPATCRVEPIDYMGWHAQQLANQWVQLIFIPQNGGRLIQFSFAGHPYLFVNPEYAGKYFPPTPGKWFNYGGDKIWLLPEGNDDEQHWAGDSDLIDDGQFTFQKSSDGQRCQVELTGPPDPRTGVRISRTIHLEAGSPQVLFRARMKNITGHRLEWSMQSVSQYDTSASRAQTSINPDFWGFAPANASSNYLNRYHVRFGPAENPAATVRDDGLFAVHYSHMAAELWLDSIGGWLAVLDNSTQYAMVERMQVDERKPYPGKASIIFWTNGPQLHLNSQREPTVSGGEDGNPYYMEAELNSPLCQLNPDESCDFETRWLPTRAGDEFHGVTEAGIVIQPLRAARLPNGNVKLTGSFGVFFSGHLVANLYDEHGRSLRSTTVMDVSPTELGTVNTEIPSSATANRVALHLEDNNHLDRGALGETAVAAAENSK
jgi:hypothetical protein